MDVLVVCRANVCRSRVAEGLLAQPLEHLGATVTSAGVDAAPADVQCPDATTYLQQHQGIRVVHAPRQLTGELVRGAGLVLVAESSVAAAVAELCPSARPRTFRLLWAASALTYVAGFIAAREVPPGAPPLPTELAARWAWLVGELDAARGQLPALPRGGDDTFYDIGDPHDEVISHTDAFHRISVACEQIGRAAYVVLDADPVDVS
jgi:protein-tyrosine-phosphatase